MTEILYIETTSDLNDFCQSIKNEEFVAVDTEFIRESTYWPILCLIQIATPSHAAIIDPLVKDINLDSFFSLMIKKDIVKVFHAARQDIEIFYFLKKIIPQPLFDTQIAVMALGYKNSISYNQLVKKLCNQSIDKSMQCTNWKDRPLSKKQLEYALADVTYLCQIYPIIKEQLNSQKRTNWIQDELDKLLDKDLYETIPSNAWKKTKNRLKKEKDFLILQKLAAWREKKAIDFNVPRNHILKDHVLNDLILISPKSLKDFLKIRNFPKSFSKEDIQHLIEIINDKNNLQNLNLDFNQLKNKRILSESQSISIDLLKILLKIIAEKQKINSNLIATHQDLEDLILFENEAPFLKKNEWKFTIFGDKAIRFLNGEIGFFLKNKKITLVENLEI